MTFEIESNEHLARLQKVIPGGAHTYSKGPDQYPTNAPIILSHGKGPYVFDLDGNQFLDYGMGLKSVILGYDYDEVTSSVIKAIRQGNNLSKPSLIELLAAEKMVSIIPNADMVKFAKNGSNVTTAALKVARAFTGKKYVCVPRQQPFFSFDDWFIGQTPVNKGIPVENVKFTLQFDYNDIDSLQKLFNDFPDDIAAVILEPATHCVPCPISCSAESETLLQCKKCPNREQNFLLKVRSLCDKYEAALIFDEMRTGFRWSLSGAQEVFGVIPDLSTFGKAIANGFSLSALVGKKDLMELAAINKIGAERTFLLSSTHGAEMGPLAAFMTTVEICKQRNVSEYLWKFGTQLKNSFNSIARELNIHEQIFAIGPGVNFEIVTRDTNNLESLAYKTLFLQEMCRNGVLITFIAPSYSHREFEFEFTVNAFKKSLLIYSQALNFGLSKFLYSEVIKPVFRKYN